MLQARDKRALHPGFGRSALFRSLTIEQPLRLGLERSEARLPVAVGDLPIQLLCLRQPPCLSEVVGAIPEELRVARFALERRPIRAVGQVAFSLIAEAVRQVEPDVALTRTQRH